MPAALLVAADRNRPWWLAVQVLFDFCLGTLSASVMRRTFPDPAPVTVPPM